MTPLEENSQEIQCFEFGRLPSLMRTMLAEYIFSVNMLGSFYFCQIPTQLTTQLQLYLTTDSWVWHECCWCAPPTHPQELQICAETGEGLPPYHDNFWPKNFRTKQLATFEWNKFCTKQLLDVANFWRNHFWNKQILDKTTFGGNKFLVKQLLDEANFGWSNFWTKQIFDEATFGQSNFWMKQPLDEAVFGRSNFWVKQLLDWGEVSERLVEDFQTVLVLTTSMTFND